jgi:4-hydroxythreonine-4-phosphate dehydrogenase
MMLIAAGLRVGLVTIHDPVRSVSGLISKRVIIEKLTLVHQSLKRDFAIRSPKIAVLGLNPHAGENGMIGQEEERCIRPAIAHVRTKRIRVDGPFPADGFFGVHAYMEYDAVLAMYHDQGLIPLKMLGFEVGVNFSAGLPLVRTSPDHGTAFDIAGKGIANPRSMAEAVRLAVAIVKNRKRQGMI